MLGKTFRFPEMQLRMHLEVWKLTGCYDKKSSRVGVEDVCDDRNRFSGPARVEPGDQSWGVGETDTSYGDLTLMQLQGQYPHI